MVTGSVDDPLSRRNLRADFGQSAQQFFQEHNQVTIE